MKVIHDLDEMRLLSRRSSLAGARVVLVPTMGYLHDGHRSLLKMGRAVGPDSLLVLSIFVNPAQFGPKEDLASYPRDMACDLEMAGQEGVDIVFAPDAKAIYPAGFRTHVEVEGRGERLCGASRPGHFSGVATVVLKLFNIIEPDTAIFGEKDFQQLRIIRKMAEDLDLDLDIIGSPTVRDPDGLAMSSRNSYLDAKERRAAQCVPASIEAAKAAVSRGVGLSSAVIEEVKKIIEKEPLAMIDYVKVCDGDTLGDVDDITNGARRFLAVRIGRARLIDNCPLGRK